MIKQKWAPILAKELPQSGLFQHQMGAVPGPPDLNQLGLKLIKIWNSLLLLPKCENNKIFISEKTKRHFEKRTKTRCA